VPLEYYDSDKEELKIFVTDLSEVKLYQKIIQKANSIMGIRKLYYVFKNTRRELLKRNEFKLTIEYMQICIEYLDQLESLREKNLNCILQKLGGITKK